MTKHNDFISSVDKVIGNKIFSLRLAKGLSRQELANDIGVTHQQLQKYEKGINRVAVGRLALIAKALSKPINYFYTEINENDDKIESTQHQRMCIEVARNFMRIENSEHQTAVNTLIKSLIKMSA